MSDFGSLVPKPVAAASAQPAAGTSRRMPTSCRNAVVASSQPAQSASGGRSFKTTSDASACLSASKSAPGACEQRRVRVSPAATAPVACVQLGTSKSLSRCDVTTTHPREHRTTGTSDASLAIAGAPSSTQAGRDRASLRAAFTSRGGVVHHRDAYEIFYGVHAADSENTQLDGNSANSQDGYDIFFGIDGRPADAVQGGSQIAGITLAEGGANIPVEMSSSSGVTSNSDQQTACKAKSQMHQREQQLQSGFGALSDVASSVHSRCATLPPRSPSGVGCCSVPEPAIASRDVPTFSLATPATSFSPPVDLAKLDNSQSYASPTVFSKVPTYSMATPVSSYLPPAAVRSSPAFGA